MENNNLFNYPKLISIIKYLYTNKANRIKDISYKNKIQYSYVSIKVKFLEKLKLVNINKKGREAFITLTEKGKEIGKRIYEIEELLK